MEKTKVFIDFDDTIFNTRMFAADLFEIFKRPGLGKDGPELFSYEEARSCYDAVYNNGYAGAEAQLQYMARTHPDKAFDMQAALDEVLELLANIGDPEEGYIYPEAVKLIQQMRDSHQVYLITVGGIEFQKIKVQNSGIEDLIGADNCIYTTRTKESELEQMGVEADEQFVLVEDKDTTIAAINEKYENAIIYKASEGEFRKLERLKIGSEGEDGGRRLRAA